MGLGGLWSTTNEFEVGVLSKPTSTSFGTASGFTVAGAPFAVTMPPTSASNSVNCTLPTCAPIASGSSWDAAGDPHGLAAYQAASGHAYVLWMSGSPAGYMAVIDLTQVLTDPSSPPAASIWYQGTP